MRQFYGNVSGESIFLAFVLFSWLSRLRFVLRAWELVVLWLCFFSHTAGARKQRAFQRKRCSGHFSCQGLSTQAVVSQAGAWTGLQFQGCGDTQWFDSTSAAIALVCDGVNVRLLRMELRQHM